MTRPTHAFVPSPFEHDERPHALHVPPGTTISQYSVSVLLVQLARLNGVNADDLVREVWDLYEATARIES